ncbi:hypothetical protein BGZ74_002833 [Mortierella antarctica]|nr:hypothetical protein BGZ74_002833 [Mortierella antarctica]
MCSNVIVSPGKHSVASGKSFRGRWEVIPLVEEGSFTDQASFVSNLCMHAHPNTTTMMARKAIGYALDPEMLPTMLGMKYELMHGKSDSSLTDLPNAKLWASNNMAANQPRSMTHVGILVLPTMEMVSQTEIPAIQEYRA